MTTAATTAPGTEANEAIVHWPRGIQAKGQVRSQFHHVIDVAPTILELDGLPHPVTVDGVQQKPIEGVSMAHSFNDPDAAERHETQYFEMFGNRGIYHKGWTAVTKHRTPWETGAEVQTPARAASSRPRPSCSRPTRPWTSATSSARR